MPPKVVLAHRKVRNSDIGIDVSVPSHEIALSPKLVKNYHVVVVTSLPHFKSAIHSEDEVVQFMVLRDYEAFEQLQKDMLTRFQHLRLPNLPRKFHIFMKDADIEERQIAFDCLLKVLCRDKEMCSSPVLLHFFGFDPLADKTYFKMRRDYLQGLQKFTEGIKDEAATDVEFTENADNPYMSHGYTETVGSGKLPFPETSLFISSEQYTEGERSEHSELLNVSEATDDVLQSVGTAKKVTIATGLHVPDRIGAKKLEESTVQDEKNVDVNVGNMQTDDILKYIQCNTEKDDKDLF